MRTVGVDLAAEPTTTASVAIDWGTRTARLDEVLLGCDDDAIVRAAATADKVGIDCPFGWPVAFHRMLADHRDGHFEAPEGVPGKDWRRELAYRTTDLVTWREHGRRPLSVAADLIAHPAMRCAGLLGRLARAGTDVSRDGSGLVAEVYPAVSLKVWGLPYRGYKGPAGAATRDALAASLSTAAPWLELGQHAEACRNSDHVLDAVIAALTARAAVIGCTACPRPEQVAVALVEGWIHVPLGRLGDLRPAAPKRTVSAP